MKQKYTKRPYNDVDVAFLTEQGLSLNLAQMLSSRGIGQHNYKDFVDNKMQFHSPFDMPNMHEVVETISYLMESGGSVLICGDYDADGLTASAVLSLFFTDNGVENSVIIPTRDEGYGLHADKVIEAFENNYYDLVITVDCGISNREEVKQIVEQLGVEVIVTDHHELPEILPDCLCINPKMGYPFPNLSGSGVAWKLVEALAGRETAMKYVDVACIGTIADLMPMQGENRAIVNAGIAHWNHKSLKYLAEISKCNAKLTCGDIAMRIGPKINAAGRVGSPEVALQLLLSRDIANKGKAEELLALNEKRKQLLDNIIADADKLCDAETIAKQKMVFLYNDDWQHGLLGIAAARYKERYNVPAIVMTRDGDNYVGSARSLENIHLFDAFCQCKDLLVKFGGHKASVGFSVSLQNVDKLQQALANVFCSLPQSYFEKSIVYDVELTNGVNVAEIYSITEKLQPLLPQDKVLCRVRDSVVFANTFGKDGSHISVSLKNGLALKGFFKYSQYVGLIKKGANVDLICSLEIDSYTKEICGLIEDITLTNSICFDEFYKLNLLKNFQAGISNSSIATQVQQLLKGDNVVAIFDDYETFIAYSKIYDFEDFTVDIFIGDSASIKNVVISPLDNCDFSTYKCILAFGKEGMLRNYGKNTHYVIAQVANDGLYSLQLDRDICLLAFSALKRKTKFDSLHGVYDKYLIGKMSYAQFVVALRVFEELKFIKIVDKYTVEFDATQKSPLTNSKIYCTFVK